MNDRLFAPAPDRGNVTSRAPSLEGEPKEAHLLTRREVLALAELNHSDPRGLRLRHRDVAKTFGVTRSAISQRVRRALNKLRDNPNPAARMYAERYRELTGRRIQIRSIKLSRVDNV